MAPDVSLRTYPLQPGGSAEDTHLPGGSVLLQDLTAWPRFGLKGPASGAWLAAAGVALPAVNRVGAHRGLRVLRLGGEDILLTGEDAGAALDGIVGAWNSAPGPKGYSSWREEGWAWMRLSGPALHHALARLCAVDLRAGRFGDDEIAQTRLSGVEVVLLRAGETFDIFFDITMSAYVARAVTAVGKQCAGLPADGV